MAKLQISRLTANEVSVQFANPDVISSNPAICGASQYLMVRHLDTRNTVFGLIKHL